MQNTSGFRRDTNDEDWTEWEAGEARPFEYVADPLFLSWLLSLVKKLLGLKVVWCWTQDNDILCNGLDDPFSPTFRRKHLDLGSQFDYITIVRQFHSGCKTAPKSFDRKYAGIIHQFKLSNTI